MKQRVLPVLLALLFASLACNLPTAVGQVGGLPATHSPLTQVVMTVQAELTASAAAFTFVPTETPAPSETPQPTETRQVPPTWTSVPAATSTPVCDAAAFIQDVTIPDGTKMNPGTAFTKTWRLRNIGACTWDASYTIVFVSGEAMGAPASTPLRGSVPPNATVDISLDMRAPNAPGTYTGYWRLRNPNGNQFGAANQPFFIEIEVAAVTPTVTITPTITPPGGAGTNIALNLAESFCQAEWRSQAGVLACPGVQGDTRGFAVRINNPQLETGVVEASPVLMTHPESSSSGAITGRYPALAVQAGDRFQAAIGCPFGASQCSVIYQLNYIIGSNPPVSLGQWTHTYSGSLQNIDIDLTPLAGQQVQIILAVLASGLAEGDQALWINPRVTRR